MGNWCGKNKAVHVHPLKQESAAPAMGLNKKSSNNLRIKVLISKNQLTELMAKMDLSKDDGSDSGSELGRLILQDCFEGKLTARVVAGNFQRVAIDCAMKRSLSTIYE